MSAHLPKSMAGRINLASYLLDPRDEDGRASAPLISKADALKLLDGPQRSMRPLGSYLRVLVRRDPDQEETAGGIVTSVRHRKHATEGVVVAIMERGVRTSRDFVRHSDVRVGERVMFGPYSGSDIIVNHETLTIMPEGEIVAVIDP